MTETLDTPIVGVFWDELIALRKILHATERHPYFEYETTRGARKCLNEDEPPEGERWARNEDKGDKGFTRFDFYDEAYWRRRKVSETRSESAGNSEVHL